MSGFRASGSRRGRLGRWSEFWKDMRHENHDAHEKAIDCGNVGERAAFLARLSGCYFILGDGGSGVVGAVHLDPGLISVIPSGSGDGLELEMICW
jgi:hypothetical protein